MTHDFKAAHDRLRTLSVKNHSGDKMETLAGVPIETILTALRFTDAALNGEVSESLVKAGLDAQILATLSSDPSGNRRPIIKAYSAMTQQLYKEVCENE